MQKPSDWGHTFADPHVCGPDSLCHLFAQSCRLTLVIFVPYLLYFLTWSLRFEEKYIVKSVFGKAVRSYPYTALLEVSKRYYISERNYIVRMYFLDGKTFHFRTDADHADKAMKVLKRHCSITAPSR